MASIFFEDYDFPCELYNRDTGDFSTPIRTLLDFTPHILQELPKKPEDQQPIRPSADHSSEFFNDLKSKTPNAAMYYASSFGNFLKDCCLAYLKSQRYAPHVPSSSYNRNANTDWYQSAAAQAQRTAKRTSTAAKSTKQASKKNAQKDGNKDSKEDASDEDDKAISYTTMKAATVGALAFSLYSTYQASAAWGDISFHNQLELLLAHVQSNLKSTKVWIEEHEKLGDPFPELIREDLVQLQELVDYLERLDSRYEKKLSMTGWSVGALGGLSTLGGVAVGSMTIMTGGAALALGGMLVSVASWARTNTRSVKAARVLLEGQAREKVDLCKKRAKIRQQTIADAFPALWENITKEEAGLSSDPLPKVPTNIPKSQSGPSATHLDELSE